MASTVELQHRSYLARCHGTNNSDHVWVIGPCLVDIYITQTRRDDGTLCWPSYYVHLDGAHIYGGPAAHLESHLAATATFDLEERC